MPTTKLPLPLEFTPPSADTEAQWKRMAVQSKNELVSLARLRGGRVKWSRHCPMKEKVQIFRGIDDAAPPGVHTWCSVSDIQASLEEVDMIFRSDSSTELLESCRLFDQNILDATTVHTVEDTSESSVDLQWLLTRTPGAFSRPRDWCLLTYNTMTKVQGRRGWVRSYVSVDYDSCPIDESRGGVIRGHHLRSGYVVMESTKPGYLHVRLAIQCTLNGNMSESLMVKAMQLKCQHLSTIDRRLRIMRLSVGADMDNISIKLGQHTRCALCTKNFSLFKSKKACQKCALVFCNTCCPVWPIQVNGQRPTIRACLSCSLISTMKSRLSEVEFGGSRRTEMEHLPDDEPVIDEQEATLAHEVLFENMKQRCSTFIRPTDMHRVSKSDAHSLWPQQSAARRRSSMYCDAMISTSIDENGSNIRPSTWTLIEDDDIAKQIWQNRRSVLQII